MLNKIASKLGFQILKKDAFIYHSTARNLYLQALGKEPEIIFDIGANVGDTVDGYNRAFPQATLHAFEPFPNTFHSLTSRFQCNANIHCHQIALSSIEQKSAKFYLANSAKEHSLKTLPDDRAKGETIEVNVTTIDDFTQDHSIDHIDILKTDTEGMELEVLKGSHQLLEKNAIGCILSEIGFGGPDTHHLTTEQISAQLAPYGYTFFGLYDLGYLQGRLHFANAMYVSK